MDITAIQKAYRRYARLYDFYFGAVFSPGRKAVIRRMHCRPGERILEVGVGTGLSLPLYPAEVEVTGVDLCPEMLERAQARKQRDGLDHVMALAVMNAEDMGFLDQSFDKVVAMYVASVVSNPARLVAEMRRVCKPGGEIFIVNHFLHKNRLVGALERGLAPLSRLIGFHPDLELSWFVQETRLDVIEQMPVNLFGYWTLLRARNTPRAAASGAAAQPAADLTAEFAGKSALVKRGQALR